MKLYPLSALAVLLSVTSPAAAQITWQNVPNASPYCGGGIDVTPDGRPCRPDLLYEEFERWERKLERERAEREYRRQHQQRRREPQPRVYLMQDYQEGEEWLPQGKRRAPRPYCYDCGPPPTQYIRPKRYEDRPNWQAPTRVPWGRCSDYMRYYGRC